MKEFGYIDFDSEVIAMKEIEGKLIVKTAP